MILWEGRKKNMFLFSKPCHVLNMSLTFWPYVLVWFVLIKKRVVIKANLNFSRKTAVKKLFATQSCSS